MLVPFIPGLQAQSLRCANSRSSATIKAPLQTETYLATRTTLSSGEKAAFMVEMAREKADGCKDASSTYDAVICLGKEGSDYDRKLRGHD
jgi:hypothetical protein